ncbi:ABC transporter ATP-binding protein/permease [Pelagibacteraceae bacterium]|jgi:ABC-type multidrug transport system fused ATPase/permease subunit|nr:ABC transporter ATP-binding protein/permease [Pelagibacteraceae bacterium]
MGIKNLLLSIYSITQIFDKKETRNFYVLLFLMVFGAALETLSIGLVLPILSSITNPSLSIYLYNFFEILNINLLIDNTLLLIMYAMLFFFFIYLLKNVFLSFLFWKQSKFIYNLMASIAEKLFRGYIYKPYMFHIQNNSSELIRNLTTEMNLFNGAVKALTTLLTEILVLFGIASLLLILQPKASFAVGVVLTIATSVFYLLTKNKIKKWGEDRQFHEKYRIQHLQQSIGGNKEIKILENESEFINQFRKHNNEWGNIGQKQNFIEAIPRLWLEIVAIGLLSILTIILILTGTMLNELVPILGMFGAAAFRLLPSINRTIGALQRLIYTAPVVNIISRELNINKFDANEISKKENKKLELIDKLDIRNWKEIKVNDISYKYPGTDKFVLDKLNLSFFKGQCIGIIGKSGEGKSTFIDVLLKLLPTESGEILIDNINIEKNIFSWRSQIGYVPQKIYLIDDSLKKNIALGIKDEEIDERKLQKSIELSQLKTFVSSLPAGVETKVGERGAQISGGQSQRIGIARALYNDPSIILFDEATSSLDLNTESEVIRSVDSLRGDKSIILVTHRISTLKNCDVIYKLEKGFLTKINYENI